MSRSVTYTLDWQPGFVLHCGAVPTDKGDHKPYDGPHGAIVQPESDHLWIYLLCVCGHRWRTFRTAELYE